MLNGLFTDLLQSPVLMHALYLSIMCLVCTYVHAYVCVFLCCCGSLSALLTYTPTQHPPTHAHTHVSKHTQEQPIPPNSAVEKKPFVPEAPPEG